MNPGSFAGWTAGGLVLLVALTWLMLRIWDRHVQREMAHEREILAAREAALTVAQAAREAAEAQRLMLLHEVNHRARNALAIVQALIRMSSGRGEDRGSEVLGRIAALSAAHDLLAQREWSGAGLDEVADRTLAAFHGAAIRLSGPAVSLGAGAVQPLSMVLHELATNSAKHGALSADGQVSLTWAEVGERLCLRWAETGGPPVQAPPTRRGVGTQVIDAIVGRQLRGEVERRWDASGLTVEIAVPAGAMRP